ncbi:MAG: nucleoside phosphorylase [Clostridium sp.]|uniref:nucleoside phosphorylase n=1 Tax=Clostridium sp. TaxID=1506 RepID=UPI003056730E
MSIIDSFDGNMNAIINPSEVIERIEGFPKVVIATFSYKVIDVFSKRQGVERIGAVRSVNGEIGIYKMNYKGREIGFYLTPVGGAFAAGTLEEIIAMGAEKVVVYGSCGSLDRTITAGHVIVPTDAYRDEGVSYHYMKPSDYISIESADKLAGILDELEVPYVKGKTWTTDAIYRETIDNMNKRKAEGCISVEMECASLAAVCKLRNVEFIQFLYSADNLDSLKWEKRILGNLDISEREKYMMIAFEISNAI